ncbi:non-ribosomal peptide synthetase, partial [Clostridium puniceum]|uniref:non-ribosomal peptide synthetase n=1 Tax=Clostridium puniceum TaxID=29367 RepID=UPI0011781688
ATADKLNNIAKETGATLYTVLLSAYNILLSKYSGQEDIIVGTAQAGRPQTELENVVGMFVNTVALRNYPKGDKTFKEFLEEVKNNTLRDFENTEYQFETLLDKLNLTREASRNPLFDTMFVLENIDFNISEDNGKIKSIEPKLNMAKFDLTLTAMKIKEGISFSLEYCSKLFGSNTIKKMWEHFVNILEQIVLNPKAKLHEINMLSKEEENKLIYEFNNTRTEYPRWSTIQELFEEQADKAQNDIAVSLDEKELTYRELNEKANSLARVLREKGIKAENIVGIIVEPSLETIIGIMAILKAGGAYLPIDPEYPEDRIKYMLKDSRTELLLTKKSLLKDINFEGEIIDLENQENYASSKENIEKINTSRDLAYVIYTSGSTGMPKGVLVEHRNVVRLVKNTNYLNLKKSDRILQTGSVVFDASTFEIWGSLLNGGSLYLIKKEDVLNSEILENKLDKYGITTLWLTSALFSQLSQSNPEIFKGIKNLLVGGDALSPKHINLVRNRNKNLKIINGYGPTENTTFSTTFLIGKNYENNIPIGKPISNSTVYILGKDNELKPIGIPGELCVGGDGVARGYLNNLELTREKFVDNPFELETKMYKTGDLA